MRYAEHSWEGNKCSKCGHEEQITQLRAIATKCGGGNSTDAFELIPNQPCFIVAGESISAWNYVTGERIFEHERGPAWESCIAFHPALPIFAVSSSKGYKHKLDHNIELRSTKDGSLYRTIEMPATRLAFDATGKILCAIVSRLGISDTGVVALFEVSTGRLLTQFNPHGEAAVTLLDCSKSTTNNYAITAGKLMDVTIGRRVDDAIVWEISTQRQIDRMSRLGLKLIDGEFGAVHLNSEGDKLLLATRAGIAHCKISTDPNASVHMENTSYWGVSPDRKHFVTAKWAPGSPNPVLTVGTIGEDAILATVSIDSLENLANVAMSHDNSMIAYNRLHQPTIVCALPSGKVIAEVPEMSGLMSLGLTKLSFSADGRFLIGNAKNKKDAGTFVVYFLGNLNGH